MSISTCPPPIHHSLLLFHERVSWVLDLNKSDSNGTLEEYRCIIWLNKYTAQSPPTPQFHLLISLHLPRLSFRITLLFRGINRPRFIFLPYFVLIFTSQSPLLTLRGNWKQRKISPWVECIIREGDWRGGTDHFMMSFIKVFEHLDNIHSLITPSYKSQQGAAGDIFSLTTTFTEKVLAEGKWRRSQAALNFFRLMLATLVSVSRGLKFNTVLDIHVRRL